MTLQALEYFISISRHLNFTKAAQECFVTQPALSRSIRELEEELGCTLLDRSSRNVKLTPVGEILQAEALHIVDLTHQLPEKIRRYLRQEEEPLRVGYLIYDHLMAFVNRLARTNDEGFPIPLDTRYYACPEAKRRFLDNELDILLLPSVCTADLPDIESYCLYTSATCAIVSKDSPLYNRKSISIRELQDMPMIGWNTDELPLLQNAYAGFCRDAGFEPRVIDSGRKLGDVLARVIVNNAVGMTSVAIERRSIGEVAYIPIVDVPKHISLFCVWKKENRLFNLKRLHDALENSRGMDE